MKRRHKRRGALALATVVCGGVATYALPGWVFGVMALGFVAVMLALAFATGGIDIDIDLF